MIENISFTKMHANGNDFVILDRIRQYCKISAPMIRAIADRHRGIGCDQVLIIDPPTDPDCDFEYRIFNHDGSEVEQCGNGARCVGRYLFQKGLTSHRQMVLHSLKGNITVNVSNIDHIQAHLGKAIFHSSQFNIKHPDVHPLSENRYRLSLNQSERECSFVSLGNPHCVFFLPSLHDEDLETLAQTCQQHPAFPQGVNVIFVQVLAKNHMKCRVFERNTGETQACGSGACAAAIAGIIKNEVNQHVQVDMPGGRLEVEWAPEQEVVLSGETKASFEGVFMLSEEWLAQN